MEVFEELAQDAIQLCTASLKMASADIMAAQGGLHGSLFLVKHLLTLREQITPFEIQFAQTSKALDFTSSADAMNELLVDTSTLFRFSGPNGLVGLFTRGIPQIQETTADVKKELEQELKKSCTAFIEIVLQQLAQPLLALMKQVAHVQQAQQATALDFRQCAFTAPVEVNSALASVSRQLRETLPETLQTIHLYLRNASTETILFKPVQVGARGRVVAPLAATNSVLSLLFRPAQPPGRGGDPQLADGADVHPRGAAAVRGGLWRCAPAAARTLRLVRAVVVMANPRRIVHEGVLGAMSTKVDVVLAQQADPSRWLLRRHGRQVDHQDALPARSSCECSSHCQEGQTGRGLRSSRCHSLRPRDIKTFHHI
jgi:hypothetical protein